ncbi:hypothetical protein [Nocardioides aurantiacus]|uniref:hypothetical protein n=1 Tax=Nocardioides aurantiacus TaxID=86796 RepID=UPI00403EFDED
MAIRESTLEEHSCTSIRGGEETAEHVERFRPGGSYAVVAAAQRSEHTVTFDDRVTSPAHESSQVAAVAEQLSVDGRALHERVSEFGS